MKVRVLFDISHLKFEGAGEAVVNTGAVIISNIDKKRESFYTPEFKNYFGTHSMRYTPGSVFAYTECDVPDSIDDFEAAVRLKLEDAIKVPGKLIEAFLTFLWLIKDNSVGLWSTTGIAPSKNIAIHISNSISYYACDGRKCNVAYSEEDLKRAGMLTVKYEKICQEYLNENVDLILDEFEFDQFGVPFRTFIQTQKRVINYNSQNCIQRAFHFLILARRQNVLIYKIAYYMAVFECLFTTDAREITMKMSQRAAFYIGNSAEECRNIAKLISDCYDVRSRFLHGQRFKKPKDCSESELLPKAVELDCLLRRILCQIIEHDHELFVEDENDKDKRERYLTGIVFEKKFRKE
jgi:hypothetical protein